MRRCLASTSHHWRFEDLCDPYSSVRIHVARGEDKQSQDVSAGICGPLQRVDARLCRPLVGSRLRRRSMNNACFSTADSCFQPVPECPPPFGVGRSHGLDESVAFISLAISARWPVLSAEHSCTSLCCCLDVTVTFHMLHRLVSMSVRGIDLQTRRSRYTM